ncbi:MAG: helix-turn-helix transcriptional regulator [Eubacteriales bacterium]
MNITVAKNLEKLRKAHGWTQETIAEKVGVSRQAVSSWEQGISSPDTDNLITLAKLYGVKVDDLLFTESEQDDFRQRRENFFEMDKDRKAPNVKPVYTRASTFPIVAFIILIYFIVSFATGRWDITWLICLAIPIYEYIIYWVEQAQGKANRHWMELFPYPLFVVAMFFLLGYFTQLWHIVWILFLTIPVYYFILRIVRNRGKSWRTLIVSVLPLLTVIIFLFIGFLVEGAWRWAWMIFLTIPIWGWMLKAKNDK